jgi:hypothetical protein
MRKQPYLDRRKLDEGEVVGRKPVAACRDATIMLDLVEESLNQVAGTIQVRAEADRLLAIASRRDIGPRALRGGIGPDPVSVIASVRQQHRSRQTGQELTSKPSVV